MNIFEEVKARVSARHVAENYGLKIGRNGMAASRTVISARFHTSFSQLDSGLFTYRRN